MTIHSLLLVEDNADDEYLSLRVLRKAGVADITVVRDGREAIDRLLDAALPLPQMVLLDLRLPRIDGLQVLEKLRADERTCSLPVLVLTSSEDPRDREVCQRLGAFGFLGKPLELVEFRMALSSKYGKYAS